MDRLGQETENHKGMIDKHMEKIGVMLCGHGSRSKAAVREFSKLAIKLPDMLPDWPVEYGYLEFANPVLRDGLDALRDRGCNRILAVPGMLFAAMHAKNDIPSVLNTYAAEHSVDVQYGRELGVDPKMISAAADRISEAVSDANSNRGQVPNEDTCLVVIGRGASDPGRERQCFQNRAHALGGHGVRMGGGRVFGRDISIG